MYGRGFVELAIYLFFRIYPSSNIPGEFTLYANVLKDNEFSKKMTLRVL